MAVVALVSAKGSPGVTTACLAFALTWTRRVLVAECDPAGGDIVAGYLRHLELDRRRGLMQLLVAELRGQAEAELWGNLIDLDPPARARLLLPGIAAPTQAASLEPSWHQLGNLFAGLEARRPSYDVVVDCGRLVTSYPPWPLLRCADLVLLTVRPTLTSLVPARAAVDALRQQRAGDDGWLGVLLVGDGPYDRKAVARSLGVDVVAALPRDVRSAAVLTEGGTVRTRRPLLRAAGASERAIVEALTRRRAWLGGSASLRREASRAAL